MEDGYASLEEMKEWALGVVHGREPDRFIGGRTDTYMERWFIVPRNPVCNVYLHRFLRSDDDRALHDHPWPNSSYLLDGCYIEHMPGPTTIQRWPGEYVTRKATDSHRIELIDGKPVLSLFITGPKVREWGFHCPQGWRHWRDFTSGPNGETVGRGCE